MGEAEYASVREALIAAIPGDVEKDHKQALISRVLVVRTNARQARQSFLKRVARYRT